jgi:hypothetical protein
MRVAYHKIRHRAGLVAGRKGSRQIGLIPGLLGSNNAIPGYKASRNGALNKIYKILLNGLNYIGKA